MNRNIILSGLVALVVSFSTFGLTTWLYEGEAKDGKTVKIEHVANTPSLSTLYSLDEDGKPVALDFNQTAEKVLDGVIHIKSTQIHSKQAAPQQSIPREFREFFGPQFGPNSPQRGQAPPRVGTGSGVIISKDGYIVTNNHVIDGADDLEVTLHDNRSFKAEVIGTDPSTDLALIQIKADGLPTVPLVNSDEVNVGQWVLAVGNPLGLNSTVTAGIVSAKGRNINILKDKYAVENFIQTDAAINPGNSGGALVNLNGGLVGINTAIASPTGTFAGYGFAVPANIVEKVVKDLLEFGAVQRGVLGVMIRTVDGNFAKTEGLDITQGVYVDSLLANSAAAKGGIQAGDVIIAVNGNAVRTSPELQGLIARYRPGETVELTVNRDGKEKKLSVILNNRNGNTELASKEVLSIEKALGAHFETLPKDAARKLNIAGGVQVKELRRGKLSQATQMREGFIITSVNGKAVTSVEDLQQALENKRGGVMLEGVYGDVPGEYYYAFGM